VSHVRLRLFKMMGLMIEYVYSDFPWTKRKPSWKTDPSLGYPFARFFSLRIFKCCFS
jgi:hypothetical protein